jgi:type II secretory pathway component PulK
MRPDERVNPNVADSVGLSAVLSDERQVASLLDWTDADTEPRPGGAEASWYAARGRQGPRNAPLAAVEEIRLIRGFEQYDAEDIRATFTTSGDGSVSPNRAPEWALRSITGVPSDLAVRLQPIPMSERHFRSADELSALLGLDPSVPEFREMARRLSFADAQTIVRATGSVDIGRAVLVSTMVATLQETRGRVQIVRLQSQ